MLHCCIFQLATPMNCLGSQQREKMAKETKAFLTQLVKKLIQPLETLEAAKPKEAWETENPKESLLQKRNLICSDTGGSETDLPSKRHKLRKDRTVLKLAYHVEISQTRKGDPSDWVPSLHWMCSLVRKQQAHSFEWTNADDYFNFAVQTCWRANKPALAA